MTGHFDDWNNAPAAPLSFDREGDSARSVDRMPDEMRQRLIRAERMQIAFRNSVFWRSFKIVAITAATIGFLLYASFHR